MSDLFVPIGNGLADAPVPPADKRIHRTVICSVGTVAEQVAERVLILSRCGMPDLPLYHLHVPGGAGDQPPSAAAQMELACDRLSDLRLAHSLRMRGFEFATPDELQVWLLLDLTAAHPDEPHLAQTSLDPAELVAMQSQLQVVAWQRLRGYLAWHVALLLEPAAQAVLASWTEALRSQADIKLYVMGPVNAQHLRLPAAEWRERVAHSLTALLWASPPAHTLLERAATEASTIAAPAAVVWCSPAGRLCSWLAHSWADRTLKSLHDDMRQAPTEVLAPTTSLEQDLSALRGRLPATEPAEIWRAPRPAWRLLRELPALMQAGGERKSVQVGAGQQQARLAWLDEAQSSWDALLSDLERSFLLAPAQPQLGMLMSTLQTLRHQLDELATKVDQRLELFSERLEQAQVETKAAQRVLQALCEDFPAYSLQGAIAALIQPWRWPGWGWRYLQNLPRTAQRLLDAQGEVRRFQREEAAWHALRQHYLAAAQKTQAYIARLRQIEKNLADANELASDHCTALIAAVPAPWTADRLEWLFGRVLPDSPIPAARFVARFPVTSWIDMAPPELTARLVENITPEVASVGAWSAFDCLGAAFAAPTASAEPALLRPTVWLDQVLQMAAPLWPAQELAGSAGAEEWLLLSEPCAQEEWLSGSLDMLERWRTHFPQALLARSVLDAVQVIRWSEVRLDLEAPNANLMEEGGLPDEQA